MFLRIVGIGFLCLALGPAVVKNRAHGSDQKVIRDNNQRVIGTIRQDPVFKNREVVRDRYERPIGTIQKERSRANSNK